MNPLKYIFLLILASTSFAFAQYEHLLHKPYAQNVLGIHSMYSDLINLQDSVKMARKAGQIKDFARRHNDPVLERNVDFFLVFWSSFYQRQAREESLRKLIRQLESASRENVDFLRARSLRALAEFYWKIETNYEMAFEQYLLLEKELESARPEDYPEMARDFMQIGKAHYYFQDYAIAAKYFKKSIELPETEFTTMVINEARNTLGLCFQQLSQLDSSDYFLKQVLSNRFPQALVWKRIATGNLGANMYLRKQYDKALPLLEADFLGSVRENDYGCAAGASVFMADIFREKGEMKKAATFIEYAKDNIAKSGETERLRLLYPVMSRWFADIGDGKGSKKYMDSSVVAINQYNEKYSALKVLRAQQRVNRQNLELELAAFTLERQQKIAQRNLLLMLVLMLFIVIVLTYFIHKKRQLTKDIKLRVATQELNMATVELNRFTESMREKNKLIETLQSRNLEEDKAGIFQELQQSTILTEDDWHSFQLLFDKVYPGFIVRVRAKYPGLSLGDLRYFVLCRLSLSTREMASMLGVSPNAVQVMRHRIRKKLEFTDSISLEELIREI